MVDEEGFEPTYANASRFTVCRLYPLGHSSNCKIKCHLIIKLLHNFIKKQNKKNKKSIFLIN